MSKRDWLKHLGFATASAIATSKITPMANDKLPKEIRDKINSGAYAHAASLYPNFQKERERAQKIFVSGAAAWAIWKVKHDELQAQLLHKDFCIEQLQQIIDADKGHYEKLQAQAKRMADALQQYNSRHEGGLLPDRFTYEKGVKALQQFKDGKEVEPVKPKAPLPDLGICQECGTRKATTDYNGHKYYVCEPCDSRLNKEFEEEYK